MTCKSSRKHAYLLIVVGFYFFRFPIGAQVVGAFIMPCGSCFFCSKVAYVDDPYFIFNPIWLFKSLGFTMSKSSKCGDAIL